MTHYYIERGDFANVYRLYHAPTDFTPPATWERITRKQAEHYAARERERRRTDSAFSGYADAYIYPAQQRDRFDEYGDIDDQARAGWHGWYLDGSYIIRHV